MHYLDGLNDKQKEAALHTKGPLLIIAGAGAGKTKTLTHRIVTLVKEGISPEKILAITFTNKAASEMREKIRAALLKEIPGDRNMPFVSTFHALGVFILREQHALISLPKYFTIADESDALSLIKEALEENGLDPKQYEPRKIKGIISRNKGDFVTATNFSERAQTSLERTVARVWTSYEKLLAREKALDFDDLLLKTVLLLSHNPNVREQYQERWHYVHIDEYQDTNEIQYELSKLLVGKGNHICVVGDSDQNIYSWRGAKIKNILNFETDYPDAKVVLLEENYRSTGTILEAANEVIKKNFVRKEKNLFTRKEKGETITIYEAYDEADEGAYVARTVYGLLESGIDPGAIAILYRANFQSRVLEEALLGTGVPYQVLGIKFFDRKEIKDTLAYVRASLNSESLSDIKRIINFPARGVGKVTLAKLFAGKQSELPATMQKKISLFYELLEKIKIYSETHSVSETIKFVILESGIEKTLKNGTSDEVERLENIEELVTLATAYDVLPQGDGIATLLTNAALASDQDTLLENKNGVRLMTVHASKGLEFKYVFITGLEQDLFPHQRRAGASTEDGEEERRLMYVALTRAEKKLYLSWASIRTIFGSRQINAPSEFLYDIPESLTEKEYNSGRQGKYITLE